MGVVLITAIIVVVIYAIYRQQEIQKEIQKEIQIEGDLCLIRLIKIIYQHTHQEEIATSEIDDEKIGGLIICFFAAAQGDPPALDILRNIIEESKEELMEAAYNQNDAQAQYILGSLYSAFSDGCLKRSGRQQDDVEKARSLSQERDVLLKKSAAQGYTLAVETLSVIRKELKKLGLENDY